MATATICLLPERPLITAAAAEASVGSEVVAVALAEQERFSYYVSARQRGTWPALVALRGEDHNFDRDPKSADVQQAFQRVVAFLREHLQVR